VAARRSLPALAAVAALALPLGATAGAGSSAAARSVDSTRATASWKRAAWSKASWVGGTKVPPAVTLQPRSARPKS
jgi:hypothetical protein